MSVDANLQPNDGATTLDSGRTGSHPSVRFEQLPIEGGQLARLSETRSIILEDVVQRTKKELVKDPNSLELLLGDALHGERVRLKRFKPNVFTKSRKKGDQILWDQIQAGMLRPSAEVERMKLLEQVLSHYSDEIGGNFDPRIYWLAIRAVPWAFSWLLNAASVRRFLPWGMTESLQSRLAVVGEVPHLQKLAKKGTILLVPTHQSNIDSVLIGYIIYLMQLPPFAYGAGLNLFSNPALSFFMNHLGAYTVDRTKSNTIYKHVLKNYSTRILREGIHSIFFPGGGRVRNGAIESKVKLGLLGTGLEAEIDNRIAGKLQPNVYVVPMVMSYHFVLEASSLIEDYLVEAGKSRFINFEEDDSWTSAKALNFFWNAFSSSTGITVRIGKPLDIFGNLVDEEGRSMGPNGTTVDPTRWLTSRGVLCHSPQRDREYTRQLGETLIDRFHRENTVMTSTVVAYTMMSILRKHYPDLDLYRLLRLSLAQRTLPYSEFLLAAQEIHRRVMKMSDRGELYVAHELMNWPLEKWVTDGITQLGLLHDSSVAKVQDGVIWTEDMNLLYYYRNRLTGYGLGELLDEKGPHRKPGEHDSKGFLA